MVLSDGLKMKFKKIRALHKNPAIEPGLDGGDLNVSNTTLSLKELKFKAYKQDEPVEGSYFRLPKELFSETYKKLSLDAKILYSILLDRLELSRRNNWINEHGELFIFFPRENLKDFMGIGKNKVTRLFEELKTFNLIREKRQGIKKANIIYVGKLDNSLTPQNRDSRIPNLGNLESPKQGGNDLKFNKTENKCKSKREFSGKPENSPPSQDNKNYSEWIRINTLKFPNSLPEYTVKRFIWSYKRHIGEEHPPLENRQLERCFSVLSSFISENDLDEESVAAIIDQYFETNFPNANNGAGCDYRFNHFATEGVLLNRFWEACY